MKQKLLYYLLVLCSFLSIQNTKAQTLAAGDIAFIGYNRVSSITEHSFSFITLKTIPANEIIYFTNVGWNGSAWNSAGESHIKWEVPTGGVACGTLIKVAENQTTANTFDVTGTTGFTWVSGYGPFFFSAGGDPLLVYQAATVAAANPTFIAGINTNYDSSNYNSTTHWQATANPDTANNCVLPSGLTDGVNAVAVYPGIPESRCTKYTGTLTGTVASLRAAINNYANWTSSVVLLAIAPSDYSGISVDCAVANSPTVTTTPATGVGAVKATMGGDVTDDGGGTITERGIVWATTVDPTTADNKVSNGTGSGSFSGSVASLASGTTINYRAYAINSGGTSYGDNLSFTTSAGLLATTGQTNVSCNAGNNGVASVTASGGVLPYTYFWSSAKGTLDIATDLTAGSYTCTITDGESTVLIKSFTVMQPPPINLSSGSQTNVSCNGGTNGSASVSPSGGTPGYSYSWSPSGGTAATATGLVAGSYTVTVTDANGCTENS